MSLNLKKVRKYPDIIFADNQKWANLASNTILRSIEKILLEKEICNIILTGGRTAQALYEEFFNNCLLPIDRIHFYFGDERCVAPESRESNFNLFYSALKGYKINPSLTVYRIRGECADIESEARRYEKLLDIEIDILLLGLGMDGHIASLFPGHRSLGEITRSVVGISQEGINHDRITITSKIISQAKEVFLLATGQHKGKVLSNALNYPDNFNALPVCFAINRTWILDVEAAMEVYKNIDKSD